MLAKPRNAKNLEVGKACVQLIDGGSEAHGLHQKRRSAIHPRSSDHLTFLSMAKCLAAKPEASHKILQNDSSSAVLEIFSAQFELL